jgi:hypothetical protein
MVFDTTYGDDDVIVSAVSDSKRTTFTAPFLLKLVVLALESDYMPFLSM